MPRSDKHVHGADSAARSTDLSKRSKLGVVSGVYIPVCLNILSILMFLRFGLILGNIGLLGMLGLLVLSYLVDFVTILSLSAVASNGEVKGGGAYYLISRSLGPEFGGSIGILFYLSQVLNAAMNVVGLIDCLKLKLGDAVPSGYWWGYFFETGVLLFCTALCFAGSGLFAKASNGLLIILMLAVLSIPFSAILVRPFEDPELGISYTGLSLATLRSNLWPHISKAGHGGLSTFRDKFGILFPATSGIFAGASMSGDLRNPSKSIPAGTLWATYSTFVLYLLVIFSMASTTSQHSLRQDANIIPHTSIWPPIILAGECAVTFFSALMGLIAAAKLLQAFSRDKLIPSLAIFGWGTRKGDEPIYAILLTYCLAQFALLADLNQIATLISMGYQMTFFVMNLACAGLKIGSAPNFRPSFKFFSWQSAVLGSLLSLFAMLFIDVAYATYAICLLILLFYMIHHLSPPKHWGDVSQNLIYHQVRKYLLRLKPEHIKFWRPQIILLVNDPRRQTRLIQFCNSMKKGSLYILGHVIVTDDFNTGVHEAKLQQSAWTKYITDANIKAFTQLTMSPAITWGVRNLILSSGLGGLRPNIAILGFYNMEELRQSRPRVIVPEAPISPMTSRKVSAAPPANNVVRRRRGDTSARMLEGILPTDVIRQENRISPESYMTVLEDLALRYRLNVAVAKGFEALETPRKDGMQFNKFIDLWPIQMSAELEKDGKSVLTTNFDTYTLILQLGYILHTVPAWMKAYQLRVMVFVEYESELQEEFGRVKALLEKLRIDATVHAFWLASGDHMTYEYIINGRADDYSTETMVNEVLKDEGWWDDLRNLRGRMPSIDGSLDTVPLEEVLSSSLRRPGFHHAYTDTDGGVRGKRRTSMTLQGDLPKNPNLSSLARLGVSMGIHTQSLPRRVFDLTPDDSSEDGDSLDGRPDYDSDADFNDLASAASEGDLDELDQDRQSLLTVSTPGRRKSYSDAAAKRPVHPPKKKSDEGRKLLGLPDIRTYGTMAPNSTPTEEPQSLHITTEPTKKAGTRSAPLLTPAATEPSSSRPASRNSELAPPSSSRPGLTRTMSASMRFSSALVPHTEITNSEGSGPTIAFKETEVTASPRPGLSRTVSLNQVSSRQSTSSFPAIPRPTSSDDHGRRVSFADQATTHKLPRIGEDAHVNIPELLLNYRMSRPDDDDESRASYGTQDIPLSFNDLPSRAQHLILNDLMRQNSHDTAVLFTTLPIPEEGTYRSEEASVQYLSDVEVLCHDLPPTLMVLSNTMTVTVSL